MSAQEFLQLLQNSILSTISQVILKFTFEALVKSNELRSFCPRSVSPQLRVVSPQLKLISPQLKVISPQLKVVLPRPKISSPIHFLYVLESNKRLT